MKNEIGNNHVVFVLGGGFVIKKLKNIHK